jgi:signal peptidase I
VIGVTLVMRRMDRWLVPPVLGASVALLLVLGIGPITGRYRVATVLSGSMSPTMDAGSMVFSTPESASSVAVGQVITFKLPTDDHRVETHRVIEVVKGGPEPVVRTKGDANPAPDPWQAKLDGSTSLWRARFAVPKLGYLVQALRGPWFRAILTLLAPALFLSVCLAAIWRRPTAPAAVAGDAGAA